jgi:serine/threonine protein kinase
MGVVTSHPTDQTIRSYGLGELDEHSSLSVWNHLGGCPSCQRRLAEMLPNRAVDRITGPRPQADRPSAGEAASSGTETDRGHGVSGSPPEAVTLPQELAEHPDYEIVRELGRGGMGVVYLARNKLMGRPEVLKLVSGHLLDHAGVRGRFLREIQAAARLQHKNIVTAYSAMRLGRNIVLAMEYVEGDDLAKIVRSSGPLPVANACYVIYQAALGLQHAHERGMVHRDIKPANLILGREGTKAVAKVLDFGLAKVTSEGPSDTSLTRHGQTMGTPDFIAPEQIRNTQSADIRADIYSLGCTFYYLLTGGPPFRGENPWDVYQAHISMNAEPLNVVRPEVPADLAALVAKMMAKAPARRFQTPAEAA